MCALFGLFGLYVQEPASIMEYISHLDVDLPDAPFYDLSNHHETTIDALRKFVQQLKKDKENDNFFFDVN